jgi:hypothetical protein
MGDSLFELAARGSKSHQELKKLYLTLRDQNKITQQENKALYRTVVSVITTLSAVQGDQARFGSVTVETLDCVEVSRRELCKLMAEKVLGHE